MKTDDKNEQEPSKKRKYKKRYLLRMLEQQEAQQEIKHYEDCETGSDSGAMDGGRFDPRQRRKSEFQ